VITTIRIVMLASALMLGVATATPAAEPAAATADAFAFGDDDSDYASNGTCEDGRFEGKGMGTVADAALQHDATDCMTLFAAGEVDVTEEERSLHPEGPLDMLDILNKVGKGGKVTEFN
jgi:hypothetical protein